MGGRFEFLKPLSYLEPWMVNKVHAGLGAACMDGLGSYFLDFETLMFYSPFDNELFCESEREYRYNAETKELLPIVGINDSLSSEWARSYECYINNTIEAALLDITEALSE